MPENERKYAILHALIQEYVKNAEPVGSEVLREEHHLPWSSATIRNDFAELEAEGYLAKPHTSGGRVPTDKAYRHYVNSLLEEREALEKKYSGKLKSVADEVMEIQSPEELMQAAAKILARFTRHMIFGGVLDRETVYGSGLPELVGEPEFSERRRVADVAQFVEDFTENVFDMTHKLLKKDLELYIGEENPVSEIRSCSLLMSDFRFSSGERGFIAMLGPTRMRYDRNIAYLQHFTRNFNDNENVENS